MVTTGRGRRHILYKQQQEQVKQTMMVTTNSTKTVRPTATVAPNPDMGSLSMSERNFSDSASSRTWSALSLILSKLQRGNLTISTARPTQCTRSKQTLHECTHRTCTSANPLLGHGGRPGGPWGIDITPPWVSGYNATHSSQVQMGQKPAQTTCEATKRV